MSVLIVTSLGDIVVDLHTDRCPLTSKNFLKLCKIKYYNGCLFHKVEKDFLAQTGDPTGTGTGGDSVYKYLYGDQARFFDDELHPELKHKRIGTIAMASAGKNLNASQFYFTLRDDLDYLDGKHTVFGIVEEKEGLETLAKINEAYVDDNGRPYKNIRIKHTYILDDPFSDPAELHEFIPEKSPEGKPNDEVAPERLEDNWVPLDENLGPAELEELIRSREAQTNAAILEGIGDIPDADIKPPENVLFVCKLNPVTQDEDLHTIFSRFGNVTSADIIRDYKTGDSLCYAFIEFETKEACEFAYDKMANVLIDDRRIHVDFSQSVSKLWSQYRHGKRKESKGSGCFKCGASDHIARDCPQDSKNKDIAPKYVLKEDNRQRGGGSQSYDMVFDEDDESSKSAPSTRGNETGHVPKRQKIEGMLHTKDSEQKESDKSYKYNRDYEGRGHRETDSRRERPSNEYYREKASRSRDHRDRDDDEHVRNPNLRRYQDTSSRHGRDEASGGKRSRNDAEMGVDRRDASGAHNSRSEEDKSGYPNSSKDRDGGTSRDLHSKESRREKYDDRKGGREHHESSRHRRDNERNRSSGLGRSDYHQRESKDKDGKRR